MINMQRLEIFVAVVEAGSFTGAAQTLGLTKAVVSFNVKQLEGELCVSLLTRSTRRVATTDTGERFYHHCLQLLQDAERILDDVRNEHSGLSGLLRITTTPEYGARVVVPALAEFSAKHPQLRIQHVSSSKNDDLISGRFDVAIRLGQLADSSHHARQIDQFDIFPVASPGYMNTLDGQPIGNLAQLADAKWIAHSRLSTPLSWQVTVPEGNTVLFNVNNAAMIKADSASSLLAFVLAGAGVAILPAWLVKDELAKGGLIRLLPDHLFPRQGIYALYPDTRHLPEKVRSFIDFLHNKAGSSGKK
ncbi:LysR family transcriptional regulator [Pantoea piersonii]|jgi:DNA-binding transcriptional LysR family regulator|uniref:LysR family transcriptional regulator n=1 Tax=Pantoea piersonii TaxID=2364647 RepID=UPI000EA2297D|nr:LysR family transcriptional regulator [Pantoea piersonii]MBZ6386767.1 LysR family transcriptional regulator [Pantoea piersonii]MBZ6400084.1 LysR family transcriptional regulator [Pantoea piersonii]MBZ6410086.1 LysR family transcriptional regulator [Pantoea piersonii]MBZ6426135.1 LysR family transcriptional regulator [Pantoea piersonii]NYB04638.1 LysR family transcriptional regulator [Pantoea piersonii]